MSKILEAMQKSAASGGGGLDQRLQAIDRGNLFPYPDETLAREFEQLAMSLIHLHDGHSGRVVVFASTNSGEGTSFVSYNCARIMAMLLERKVAWVDANFASPTAKLVGNALNLKNLLADPDGLPALDDKPELVVIGNGDPAVKSMNMLNTVNYERLVKRLEENFYFTIIDAPPVLGGVEVAHLAQGTMGLVLVVESQRLKHEVIRHGLEKLNSQGVDVLGTVLNKRAFQLPDFLYRRL